MTVFVALDEAKRALPGEAPDVLTKSYPRLLSVVFEIPWVLRTRVGALEVSHENLL